MMRNQPFKFDFLIGAGMSKSAGIPLAGELVKEINNKFRYEINSLPQSKRSDYGACMGVLTVEERKELLKPYLDEAKVNWAHIALAALIKAKHVRRVLTFNFDHILARACGLLGVYPATYDFGIAPASHVDFLSSPAIIHLHGQGFGPVMMNSDVETAEHAAKVEPLIADCLNHSNLIVIGYSGEADKVFPKLISCYQRRRRIFWIGRAEEPGDHLSELLHGENSRYCRYIGGSDADSFMVELAKETDSFPPNIFADPAGHLLDEMKDIVKFPLAGTGAETDILEETRNRLRQYGEDLRLPPVQRSVLSGERLSADLEEHIVDSDAESENERELRAWQHFDRAGKLLSEHGWQQNEETLQKACAEYEAALRLKPTFYEAFLGWGGALYFLAQLQGNAEILESAVEKIDCALQLKPDSSEALTDLGGALFGLAQLRKDEKLADQAIEMYQKALQIDPNNARALNNWGASLVEYAQHSGNPSHYEQAIEKCEGAIKLASNFPHPHNHLGKALAKLAGIRGDERLFNQAFESFQKAVSIDPKYYMAWNNWGAALVSAWRATDKASYLDEAEEKLDEARFLAPTRTYHLALLAAARDNEFECRRLLTMAKENGTLPRRAHIESDFNLDPVRSKNWFKRMLADINE